MIIVTIRTDRSEAEIGLFDDQNKLAYEKWLAHRELSTTILVKIKELLSSGGKDWNDIDAAVCFKGPGSFTGLRIGLTVANTLASQLNIPIVGAAGDEWLPKGTGRLLANENDKMVVPEYGAAAHITKPKK